ncbi:dimethylsulfonioproprionate lyase family protein [Sinorhizobium meliloti]|uniref:dimethylsulfonioproprionate lyase family protein n=1 Tax=Rhizobium meliloti TaxID=382 RepID=UPI003D648631
MAKFIGSKVVHLLQTQSLVITDVKHKPSAPPPSALSDALPAVASHSADGRLISCGLASLAADLDWYQGSSGLYASANFGQSHAHAILAGPGGLEERSDVCLGVSIMAPYTRFPDHEEITPRVVLALSKGEFRSDSGEWCKQGIGSLICNSAGCKFAMRCTSQPLLILWCQRLGS